MVEELQLNKFSKLNVLITGVSSGIGYAVAKSYLKFGSTVFGMDNNQSDNLNFNTDNFHFFLCDVSNDQITKDIIQNIFDKFKFIDILINCAGIIDFKSIEESSYEFWNKIINVNLTGTFLMCKNVIPKMKEYKKGSVINVSSRAAKYGGNNESAYCASKFGVEGLSRALYEECRPYNIVVNTITPGTPIHTAMSETTYSNDKKKIWIDPILITPAFLHLGIQNVNGINNQYVDAWKLSQEVKSEYPNIL